MPYRISRLGHVEIRSWISIATWTTTQCAGLALTGREGKTAYLKGWDERHAYSVCLTEADRAGMVVWPSARSTRRISITMRTVQDFGVKYEVIPEDYRRAGRCVS